MNPILNYMDKNFDFFLNLWIFFFAKNNSVCRSWSKRQLWKELSSVDFVFLGGMTADTLISSRHFLTLPSVQFFLS